MINCNFSSIQKNKHKAGALVNYKLARKTIKIEIFEKMHVEFAHEITLTLVQANDRISRQYSLINSEIDKAHFDLRIHIGKFGK